jgi:glutamyl-tRNA reductase
VERFKIIAFTHKSTELNNLSRFFIDEEIREEKLKAIKQLADIDELIYVATCNRIEFLFANNEQMDTLFLHKFF